MLSNNFSEIASLDLSAVVGGTQPSAAQITAIKQQAQEYCPVTAKRYANVNPATVTRAQAQDMGDSCVAEITPFLRGAARSRINGALNDAFGPAPTR
jgi:hypothetical protein